MADYVEYVKYVDKEEIKKTIIYCIRKTVARPSSYMQ